MRLVAYTRLSQENAHEGESHDAQLDRIQAWAADNGHDVVAHFRDTCSGENGTEDRPGFLDVLAVLDDGDAEGLAISALDRLARRLHVQEALLGVVWHREGHVYEVGLGEVSRDDPSDPARTLIRQVMGAVSQYERAMIVKRMSDGRRRAIAEGRIVGGGVPLAFGWTRGEGDRPVPVAGEIEIVAQAAERRERGDTLRGIATFLADRTGRNWHPVQVSRMLDRWERFPGVRSSDR